MTKPLNYDGPSIEIVLKDQKADKEQTQIIVEELLKTHISGKKVAIFQKNEQPDGPLSECVLDLASKTYDLVEMKSFMDEVNKVKI